MKKTQTSRAFAMSLLSLLLCVAMLVGSTFAWFTDTATTGVNTIVAGNLDMKVSWYNADDEWEEIDNSTKLFKDGALWEPGYTEVAYLKVENVGSLSFKYKLAINVANEVIGTSVTGEPIALSKILKFDAVAIDEDAFYATRADALDAVEDTAGDLTSEVIPDELKAGDPAKYYALVVYMPETVGNEANHKTGTTPPSIQMGVNIAAAQLMSENDSFGNDYDETAEWPVIIAESAPDLVAAFNQTQDTKIILSGDVTLSNVNAITGNKAIDLNGNKLTIADQKGITVTEDATLTVDNGIIEYTNFDIAPIYVQNNSVVNIEDGAVFEIVSEGEVGKWSMAAAVYVNQGGNSVVNINGGVINARGDNAIGIYANYASGNYPEGGNHTINLNGGVINVDGAGAIAMDVVSKNTINLNGGEINVNGEGAMAFNVGQSQGKPTVVTGNGKTVVNLYEGATLCESGDAAQFENVNFICNQAAKAGSDEELANALADETNSVIYLAAGEYAPFVVGRDNVTIKGVIGATKAESSVITNTATNKIVLGKGTFADDKKFTVAEIHKLNKVDGVTLENLWIDATAKSALNSWDCDVAIIVSPYYESVGKNSTNTTITGCYIEGDGNNTMTLALGDGFAFTNNTVKNFGVGFYAETNVIKNQIISGNTFEGVKNAISYVMTKGGKANITVTDNTVVDTTVFTLWDYAQWADRNSTTTTASGFESLTISGNNGNINYNLTHFNNRAATPCTITLGTGVQSINYINGVAFDIAYADRANYTITNTDGTALDRTTQGRNNLSVKITVDGVDKAACYELASGTYYIVNNTTGDTYQFTVTEPVVGTQQYIQLTNKVN